MLRGISCLRTLKPLTAPSNFRYLSISTTKYNNFSQVRQESSGEKNTQSKKVEKVPLYRRIGFTVYFTVGLGFVLYLYQRIQKNPAFFPNPETSGSFENLGRRFAKHYKALFSGKEDDKTQTKVMKLHKGLWKNLKKLLTTETKPYRIISSPGKVTPMLSVPDHIVRPNYANGSNPKRPNTIDIKSDDEIMRMRRAGSLANHVLSFAKSRLKPGITTDEIDKLVHYEVLKHDAYPSPLRYKGFPKSCCTSINNVICHGVPDQNKLVSGDVINVDVSVFLNGYHGDTSDTFSIGDVDQDAVTLIKVTQECLNKAIEVCGPGRPFNVIGEVIENCATAAGYSVCRRFIGHGIGSYFHGPPNIFHYATPQSGGNVMKPGMTFTIEPILVEGSDDILHLDDGWTVVTKDGGRAAQCEHTILITNHGCKILT